MRTDQDTARLLIRLWREQVSRYRLTLTLVLALSAAMAGATALYPLVLQYAGIASGVGVASRIAVAPADIIASAVDAVAHAAGAATIERQVSASLPLVQGDPAALRSAVENLIANAVKYGGEDGWVGVRAEASGTTRRPQVAITVEDHGPGIPSDELPLIFNAFYRGQNAVGRQIQGNGLGLALVTQIVSAHGGRVTVASRPGAGSAFTIHLPVQS